MPTSKLKLISDKQKKGEGFEHKAAQFLNANGLELVAKNWLVPKVGEIDLIMLEKGQAWDVLVFIEVRVRSKQGYGDAFSSITKAKQTKLIKTAKLFLQQHPHYQDYECRFDVVGFSETVHKTESEQVDWVKGAFLANAW